jgi:hypothetical protein
VQAICDAWQVTVIDPEWGRDDLLWPLLWIFAGRLLSGDSCVPPRYIKPEPLNLGPGGSVLGDVGVAGCHRLFAIPPLAR